MSKSPLKCLLSTLAGFFLLAGVAVAQERETPGSQEREVATPQVDVQIESGAKADSEDARALLEEIVTPMVEEAFAGVKDINEIPLFAYDENEDCALHIEALNSYWEKLREIMLELEEESQQNGELGALGKLRAINALRLVFQYAVVKRPFTPGHCVERFEEVALPEMERFMESLENSRKNAEQH